jgi:hypothetical protein
MRRQLAEGYWRKSRALISTPGKRKRCTAKRATSSSVRRVRIGRLSKFFDSSRSLRNRLRSRCVTSTSSEIASIVSSRFFTFDGMISSV